MCAFLMKELWPRNIALAARLRGIGRTDGATTQIRSAEESRRLIMGERGADHQHAKRARIRKSRPAASI